jgi:hypothetical protein
MNNRSEFFQYRTGVRNIKAGMRSAGREKKKRKKNKKDRKHGEKKQFKLQIMFCGICMTTSKGDGISAAGG